jgi:DNA polymerase I-like protein with 3'-5' exonuclease and polymerase domains
MEEGLDVLRNAEMSFWHNGIEYDIPVLQTIYPGWEPKGRVMDTLVMSRTLFAHRKEADFALARKRPDFPKSMIGKHSLEAWGYRLGLHKIEYPGPWDEWSLDMQVYCEGDVDVEEELVKFLRSRRSYDSSRMRAEHQLASYLYAGRRTGIPFDKEAAEELYATLAEEREKSRQELAGEFGCWFEEGKEFVPKRDNRKMGYVAGAPCTKLKLVEFNANSRPHIAKVLKERYDWEPTEFTPSGAPEISEDTLDGLDYPPVEKLQRHLMVTKRIGALATGPKAWLKFIDDANVMHPKIYHGGAVTHRGKHSDPNITQVPKVKNPFGPECRSLFRAPPGWLMMGADASGLELRCLGHYMARWDDGEYVKILLEENPHERHQAAIDFELDYDDMKTWFYAYLYGAGNQKLGRPFDPKASEEKQKKTGKHFRAKFEKGLPALGLLQDRIKKKAESGWIKLVDGRPVLVRSEHSALNSLLQGTGALICKYWICDFDSWMTTHMGEQAGKRFPFDYADPSRWKGQWAQAIWAHDEIQVFIMPHIQEVAEKMAVETISWQQERFNFRCPLTGEAKTGMNWKETH